MANQFLIKETMTEMRALSAAEITSLIGINPIYAGIQLLGYYEKGDTPNPIIYYLSNTTDLDDGGSIITISNIKVKHNFEGEINVKYFGIFEAIEDNSTQLKNIIKLINQGITGIIICNSLIKFASRLIFENKESFTVVLENSTLLDSTKILPNQAGTGGGRVPVGILFKNCKNFVLHKLKCQSNCNSWFEVAALQKDNLHPHIEFYKCSKFTLKGIQCNGYVGGYLSLNQIEPIPYDLMRGCYVTLYQSADFSIYDFDIPEGAGGGEFLCINKCENIKIKSITHNQRNSNITFWSLGKFIDNKNLEVDGLRIKSNSAGSLFDIAGENIIIQNGVLDYPLGKVLDVTFEWGQLNIDTKDATLRNIKTNGVVCISAGHASNSILTRIKFDNVVSTVKSTTEVYNLRGIESLEIRNTEFHNNQNIISMSPLEEVLRKPKKVLISNSNVTFKAPSPSDLSIIELCGLTEWKDSNFGGDSNLLGLKFLDRFAQVTNQTDLSTSFSKIVFSNCNFRNLSIAVPVNIEFINCTFNNVRFFNTSITYSKMTVKFTNCCLNYTNINPLVSTADRWFECIRPSKYIFE